MLRSIDTLCEGFQNSIKKSKKECGERLEEIRQFTFCLSYFHRTLSKTFDTDKKITLEMWNSLTLMCYIELMRLSGHIVFFTYSGLYRQAFNDIRYALESIVQAVYLDNRHQNASIETKIEILREVENKRDYHAGSLIAKLEGISKYKNLLKKEYSELSQNIHHTHRQIIATMDDLLNESEYPVTIKSEEVSRIFDSLKKLYDIFLLLFVMKFPQLKAGLKENDLFTNAVKKNELEMLSNLFDF